MNSQTCAPGGSHDRYQHPACQDRALLHGKDSEGQGSCPAEQLRPNHSKARPARNCAIRAVAHLRRSETCAAYAILGTGLQATPALTSLGRAC